MNLPARRLSGTAAAILGLAALAVVPAAQAAPATGAASTAASRCCKQWGGRRLARARCGVLCTCKQQPPPAPPPPAPARPGRWTWRRQRWGAGASVRLHAACRPPCKPPGAALIGGGA